MISPSVVKMMGPFDAEYIVVHGIGGHYSQFWPLYKCNVSKH